MLREKKYKYLLIVITVALVYFNIFPFLSIANKVCFIMGIPTLFFYIFLMWLVCIIGVALLTEKLNKKK